MTPSRLFEKQPSPRQYKVLKENFDRDHAAWSGAAHSNQRAALWSWRSAWRS